MSELEDKIRYQYKLREGKAALYDSVYARLSDVEREKSIVRMLSEFMRPDSTVLEIGAGHGGNISMLENAGFKRENIYLNELLPERIEHLKIQYPGMVIYEGDALKIDFKKQFDCVFQSTVFTSILDNNDRVSLAEKMWQLLKPGGVLLWYDFVYNNPANKAVKKVSREELLSLFDKSKKCLIEKITLAPPIGRRVGKMYNLFNFPFLRSHILAVFQK